MKIQLSKEETFCLIIDLKIFFNVLEVNQIKLNKSIIDRNKKLIKRLKKEYIK